MLLFVLMAVLALIARRNLALYALCLAPAVARHAWALMESRTRRKPAAEPKRLVPRVERVVNPILLGMLMLAAALKMIEPLSVERNVQAVRVQQPLGALAYLKQAQPAGPLFNSYSWGGYLMWDVWPAYLTYVDGRTDLFDDQVLSDYLRIWNGEAGWEDVLRSDGVRLALIEPRAPVVDEMTAAGWQVLYSDAQALVLAQPASQAGG